MIKLKDLLSELTQHQKELKKDYLFKQTKMHSSNTIPTWSEMWKAFKSDGDNLARAIESYTDWRDIEAEPQDESEILHQIEEEQKSKYFDLINLYKHLDGEKCWRSIKLPSGVDPTKLSQIGIYWAIEEHAAEAHWGKSTPITAIYEGIIDLHNVDWPRTLTARMSYIGGDEEKEIRFLKNSPIFISRCHSYDGTVGIRSMNRQIIDDWRRT